MKTYNANLVLSSVLALALLGCSSGGDSNGATKAKLTPQNAEEMAVSAASALPGCTYRSDTYLLAPDINDEMLRLYKQTVEDIKYKTKPYARAYPINQQESGTCPTNPGSVTMSGEHSNGTDNVTYTFDNYCTGDSIEQTVINGGFNLKTVAEPTDFGPIPEYTEIKSASLSVTDKSSEGTYTSSVDINKFKYTYGNGNNEPTASSPNLLTISSFSARDGQTGEKFDIANVNIEVYNSGSNSIMTINQVTYTDPKNGSVSVSSQPIVVDENGNASGGALTVQGADGSSMTMEPDPSVNNGYTVNVDGQDLGVVDCSGLI